MTIVKSKTYYPSHTLCVAVIENVLVPFGAGSLIVAVDPITLKKSGFAPIVSVYIILGRSTAGSAEMIGNSKEYA